MPLDTLPGNAEGMLLKMGCALTVTSALRAMQKTILARKHHLELAWRQGVRRFCFDGFMSLLFRRMKVNDRAPPN